MGQSAKRLPLTENLGAAIFIAFASLAIGVLLALEDPKADGLAFRNPPDMRAVWVCGGFGVVIGIVVWVGRRFAKSESDMEREEDSVIESDLRQEKRIALPLVLESLARIHAKLEEDFEEVITLGSEYSSFIHVKRSGRAVEISWAGDQIWIECWDCTESVEQPAGDLWVSKEEEATEKARDWLMNLSPNPFSREGNVDRS